MFGERFVPEEAVLLVLRAIGIAKLANRVARALRQHFGGELGLQTLERIGRSAMA